MEESQLTTARLMRLSGSPADSRVKTSSRGVHVLGWEPCDLQTHYLLPRASPTKSRFAVRRVQHIAQYLVPSITSRE